MRHGISFLESNNIINNLNIKIMKDLEVGEVITVNTPWEGDVVAVVLNVDSEYLDYKKQNKNYVTLYAKGYLLKAIYYSWICWEKDVNGRPYKEIHSTELENLKVIIEGVHMDYIDGLL